MTVRSYFVLVDTLSEDEDETMGPAGGGVRVKAPSSYASSGGSDFNLTPGGPFSALTPSMWPQDILHKLSHPVSLVIISRVRQIIIKANI